MDRNLIRLTLERILENLTFDDRFMLHCSDEALAMSFEPQDHDALKEAAAELAGPDRESKNLKNVVTCQARREVVLLKEIERLRAENMLLKEAGAKTHHDYAWPEYVCRQCGKSMLRKNRGPAPTYCSDACRKKYKRATQ